MPINIISQIETSRDCAHIISTAQQAKPNVIGHIEPCLAQLTTLSIVERTYSEKQSPVSSITGHPAQQSSPAPFFGVSRLS